MQFALYFQQCTPELSQNMNDGLSICGRMEQQHGAIGTHRVCVVSLRI